MTENIIIGMVSGLFVLVFWSLWILAQHDARITDLERKNP